MSCDLSNCNRKKALIIGDCKYCELQFCSTHRLPESHDCVGLHKCKKLQFDKNKNKLLSEKLIDNHINS